MDSQEALLGYFWKYVFLRLMDAALIHFRKPPALLVRTNKAGAMAPFRGLIPPALPVVADFYSATSFST